MANDKETTVTSMGEILEIMEELEEMKKITDSDFQPSPLEVDPDAPKDYLSVTRGW